MVSLRNGDPLDAILHKSVDIPSTGDVVVESSLSRRYLLIVNDSNAVVYLYCGQQGLDNTGIRLNADGGQWEMNTPILCAVYAKHNKSGTKRLLVTEGW